MIRVDVKPRRDDRFDITVADDNGNVLLNSDQGYENVEDAVAVARRIFGPVVLTGKNQTVALWVEFRDGRTHTEQLR